EHARSAGRQFEHDPVLDQRDEQRHQAETGDHHGGPWIAGKAVETRLVSSPCLASRPGLLSASVESMPIRTASARWQGNLTEGSGTIRTGQGGYEGNYSFKSRFEEGEGTNPEELIGAAHA